MRSGTSGPLGGLPGNHLYVTDGVWAFDFNGWTPEAVLLDAHQAAYVERYPGWAYELAEVPNGLEDFCAQSYHRPPAYFAYLPWERTYNYIKRFPDGPPVDDSAASG